ncbi:hypothetical protein [uncultured Deefgea sp.]|uniref:hypothetical protein n=1 Tax=uncultured Deefgea sp. TaxID=1304914 RepID=UPI0026162CC6|nr:hypothetical protein [uncultured Deefgea sp.]
MNCDYVIDLASFKGYSVIVDLNNVDSDFVNFVKLGYSDTFKRDCLVIAHPVYLKALNPDNNCTNATYSESILFCKTLSNNRILIDVDLINSVLFETMSNCFIQLYTDNESIENKDVYIRVLQRNNDLYIDDDNYHITGCIGYLFKGSC